MKPSLPKADQYLGWSVAIDGDTMVAGAFESVDSKDRSGAVYVFVRKDGVWTEQARLTASNAGAQDFFGEYLALSGDTIVVGAWGEDSGAKGVNGEQNDESASYSGAVYVFTRTDGAWSQQAYIKASNTEADDRFGTSLAVSGDTLAVGAVLEGSHSTGVNGEQDNNLASGSGAVYVFTRTAGVWTQQAYVKASNTGGGDMFGTAIALSGDTLAVTAPGEASNATGVDGNPLDNSASGAGAVYVFTRTGNTWTQQAYVKASNTDAWDSFGTTLALSGDTLAVGAAGEASAASGVGGNQADNSAGGAGAVYVFTRAGGAWTQQAYLKASNSDSRDYFGVGLALSGDTLAVSTPSEASLATGVNGNQADNTGASNGAVYLFARKAGLWTQTYYVKATAVGLHDSFGKCVALSGTTLAIGVPSDDSNAAGVDGNRSDNSLLESGAVYIMP